MKRKLLISNAMIATSTEVIEGAVLVDGETIAAVLPTGSPLPPADEVLDAEGKFLLPGGVDPHTHFDLDVGFTRASDDFYTGSVAAACGGTTTVIDHMAFGPPGAPLTHQVDVYRQLARDAVIDYGLHGVIQHVDAQVLDDMQLLRDREGISSLKLYLTYDQRLDDADAFHVLQRAKQLDMMICVHCESHGLVTALREQLLAQGHTQARFHPLSRPPQAEAEAVFRILELASAAGNAPVYIVHLSAAAGLDALTLARQLGHTRAYAETCPQYLFLDDALYNDPQEGLKYIMCPPLRTPADQEALWQGLAQGTIQTVGTDHCPFFFATQKQRGAQDFTLCPSGAPGVELRMPLLFSQGFLAGRLTLPQVVCLACTNPARLFGLHPQKGDILPGADADLVLFDPVIEWTVDVDKLHENVDYTPYQGMQLQGKPVLTLSRGTVVMRDGGFAGHKGAGRYLRRGAPLFE